MVIDITNEVFTKLKTRLTGCTVEPSYPKNIPDFPLVTVEEVSNLTYTDSIDSSGETMREIALEINVFSDAENSVTVVKGLRNRIDDILTSIYRMTCDFSAPTHNYLNSDIYRYTMRFSCVVDKNKTIYRR